jgi:hypothetical protein
MSYIKKGALIISLFLIITSVFASDVNYLIITADRFYNAIQPLAQWKNQKGVITRVVKLSQVGGNDPKLIRNFIANAYNNSYPKLEYVLLVGDINFIHPYEHPDCGRTDNPYADIGGDAQLELSIGRLPCRNVPQLRSMVNKIFLHERTPYLSDTLWYRKATTIRQDPGPYHNAGAHFVHSLILDHSNYQLVDTFWTPSNNAAEVSESIIQGRSYVLYIGHGAGSYWPEPFNVRPSIRNGKKFPIIFSWSCQTLLRTGYLGQRWLKAGTVRNPYGAVAYIGSTTSGLYARYRNFVARNFFRAIFEHHIDNIGKALKEGLDSLWTYTPDSFGRTLYPEWNLLGDPEMNLWTQVPKPMRAVFDTSIGTGKQTFTVNVMTIDRNPITNALVCVMSERDTNCYYYGYTDNLGKTELIINPAISGPISVTVTAQNFIPFEGRCLVVSNSSINIAQTQNSINADDSSILWNPIQTLLTVRISPILGYKTLKIFDVMGRLVRSVELKWKNNRISLDGIKNGVYFVSLETESGWKSKKIIFLK